MLLAGVIFVGAVAAPDPFRGAWESIDIDGSYQTLNVGGGPAGMSRVNFHDRGATVCGLDPATGAFLAGARARGFLSASGLVLSGDLEVICTFRPPVSIGAYTLEFTYDPLTDTLIDGIGVTWTRR